MLKKKELVLILILLGVFVLIHFVKAEGQLIAPDDSTFSYNQTYSGSTFNASYNASQVWDYNQSDTWLAL